MAARIPKTVSPYYAALEGRHKETMIEMRSRILKTIPKAQEIMKYGMPTFVINGNEVAGLMSHKNHIGYYPYSGSVIKNFPELLKKYKTSKGAIQIPLGESLTQLEIKRLVKARIALCPVTRGEVNLSHYAERDEEWRAIGLAAPARRGLVDKKLTRLQQLGKWREEDVKKIHAMGPNALKILKKEMKKRGIAFK
jgi:uncharacterized protein YdhG (YjbR/CyaY superfamily)